MPYSAIRNDKVYIAILKPLEMTLFELCGGRFNEVETFQSHHIQQTSAALTMARYLDEKREARVFQRIVIVADSVTMLAVQHALSDATIALVDLWIDLDLNELLFHGVLKKIETSYRDTRAEKLTSSYA